MLPEPVRQLLPLAETMSERAEKKGAGPSILDSQSNIHLLEERDSPRSENRRFWNRRRVENWVETIPPATEGLPLDGILTCPPPTPAPSYRLNPACSVSLLENGRTHKFPEYKSGRNREDGGPRTKIRKPQIRHQKKKRIKKSEITIGDLSTAYAREKTDDSDVESQEKRNANLDERRLTAFLRDRMLPPIRVQYGTKPNFNSNEKIVKRRGNKNTGLKAARNLIHAKKYETDYDTLSSRSDEKYNKPGAPKFPEIKIPSIRGDSVPSKRTRKYVQDNRNDLNYEIYKADKLPRLSNNERRGEKHQFYKRLNSPDKKEKISFPPLLRTPSVSKVEKDRHQMRLEQAISKALKKPVNTSSLRWPSMNPSHVIQSRTSKLPYINTV